MCQKMLYICEMAANKEDYKMWWTVTAITIIGICCFFSVIIGVLGKKIRHLNQLTQTNTRHSTTSSQRQRNNTV